MEHTIDYAMEPTITVRQLVSAVEPWVAVVAVDDPQAPDGVRLFTRRIACWALIQRPGDVERLEGLSAQEEAAGELFEVTDYRAVLGYAPADEVTDLPNDRTDWRALAREWPAMRRAMLGTLGRNGAHESVSAG